MLLDDHGCCWLISNKCNSRRFGRSSCGHGSQMTCIDLEESASHCFHVLKGVPQVAVVDRHLLNIPIVKSYLNQHYRLLFT